METAVCACEEESKMFCSRCGGDLGEGQVCVHCGWSVGDPTSPVNLPQADGGTAMASLVCGIISLSTCGGGLFLPCIGLGLGMLALKSQRQDVATVGVILNTIVLAMVLLSFILLALLGVAEGVNSAPSSSGRCC